MKKGDLQVTILEIRNVGVATSDLHCSVSLKTPNQSARTFYTTSANDIKVNQRVDLDLMNLEGEELLIQVFNHTGHETFLGQIQLQVSAMHISKEPQWYSLSAKPIEPPSSPESAIRPKPQKHNSHIGGEVLVKLNFVHRLIKAKSLAMFGPTARGTPQLVAERPSGNEEIIIDDALKEKQRIAKEKLMQGKQLVRRMSTHILQLEATEGAAAAHTEKTKLGQIKQNLNELQKILDINPAVKEFPTIEDEVQYLRNKVTRMRDKIRTLEVVNVSLESRIIELEKTQNPSNSSATKKWSCEDVISWMSSLSLSEDYSDVILDNHINGEVLLSMSKDDWHYVGITKFGDVRILEYQTSEL